MFYRPLILLLGILCLHQTGTAHPGAQDTLEHFTREIEAQPKQQRPYIQRGLAYSNDGQYEKALADLRQAEQLGDPELVRFDLGVLYYRMGEYDTARSYFDAFLQEHPDNAQCLEYRARAARDAGDYKAAIVDFKHFFNVQPHPNPGHYISTAEMLSTMGPEGIDEALAILDQGNAQLGITPQLQNYAIELELERGRTEQAIERLDQLEPMLGETPVWKVDKAELLLQTGKHNQATSLLDQASLQLQSLRKTPARLATQERIDRLLKAPG